MSERRRAGENEDDNKNEVRETTTGASTRNLLALTINQLNSTIMKKYLIQIILFLLLASPWACIGAAGLLYCDSFTNGCIVAFICIICAGISCEVHLK